MPAVDCVVLSAGRCETVVFFAVVVAAVVSGGSVAVELDTVAELSGSGAVVASAIAEATVWEEEEDTGGSPLHAVSSKASAAKPAASFRCGNRGLLFMMRLLTVFS